MGFHKIACWLDVCLQVFMFVDHDIFLLNNYFAESFIHDLTILISYLKWNILVLSLLYIHCFIHLVLKYLALDTSLIEEFYAYIKTSVEGLIQMKTYKIIPYANTVVVNWFICLFVDILA